MTVRCHIVYHQVILLAYIPWHYDSDDSQPGPVTVGCCMLTFRRAASVGKAGPGPGMPQPEHESHSAHTTTMMWLKTNFKMDSP